MKSFCVAEARNNAEVCLLNDSQGGSVLYGCKVRFCIAEAHSGRGFPSLIGVDAVIL